MYVLHVFIKVKKHAFNLQTNVLISMLYGQLALVLQLG